jgi:hypothetical protein
MERRDSEWWVISPFSDGDLTINLDDLLTPARSSFWGGEGEGSRWFTVAN